MLFSTKNKPDVKEDKGYWKILVVDDDKSIHDLTKIVLSTFSFDGKELQQLDAFNISQAKEILTQNPDIALVLLDVVLQGNESGLDLVKYIRDELKNKKTRIVIRTGQPGIAPEETIIKEYDINDYKEKTELTNIKFFTTIYAAIRSYKDLCNLEKLQIEEIKNFEQTLYSLTDLVEKRDSYTASHSKRVANYCVLIAKAMYMFSEIEIQNLYKAGMLHDIGKIVTPDTILLKPGKLNSLEYKLIQDHICVGYNILSKVSIYKELAEIMHCHHERYDGKGYPRGLKGKEIPLLGQIMIVADAFDAMTTNRIYKKKKSVEIAIEEIESLSEKQFHPQIVKFAKVALKDVVIEKEIDQNPRNLIEEERFVYFFKDYLTGAYNKDYLDTILFKQDVIYKYLHKINLHNFSNFNKEKGWDKGDDFLKKFTKFLQSYYTDALVFRVQGDDFILANKVCMEIKEDFINGIDFIKNSNITISVDCIDAKDKDFLSLKI
ncbi:MAG: HD domain-containing protein [Epsilonproteobacteria bacterium]|nr:HD domain-containing protein [Campylobacterota bacterium]